MSNVSIARGFGNVQDYPLLTFLIPTVLIGYGMVIPRSPIAGLNELTIGFGSSLVGAAIAYWQGIRAAQRREAKVGEQDQGAIGSPEGHRAFGSGPQYAERLLPEKT